ncbi:MAG: class II glutamine amidotransferase [Parachlamydiaceae bacterium]|nr:class II glutamine amidotransferase [Parachlamydiaceae bacterium]
MNYLLGMSLESNGFPQIIPSYQFDQSRFRFGLASYPLDSYYATIIKNAKIENEISLTENLYRGKAQGISILLGAYYEDIDLDERNSPPYFWTFAGRAWVIACQLNLKEDFKREFSVSSRSALVPIGNTDEEYLFCALLDTIYSKGANSLADLTWPVLNDIFHAINHYGDVEILLSDGKDLVVYHDLNPKKPSLYALRSSPPHNIDFLQFEQLKIELDAVDLNHTISAFTNNPEAGCIPLMSPMHAGQMIVTRNGEYIWNSHAFSGEPTSIRRRVSKNHIEKDPIPVSQENPLVLSQITSLPLILCPENEECLEKEEVKPKKEAKKAVHPISVTLYRNEPFFSDPNLALYSVFHSTHYYYDDEIGMSKHLLRLQPVHDLTQHILQYTLSSSVPGKSCSFQGVFGNSATIFDISDAYRELVFTSQSFIALTEPPLQRLDLLYKKWTLPLVWMPWDHIMLQAYLTPPELAESELYELSEYAMSFVKRNDNCVIDILNDLNRTIYRDYTYISGSTNLSTTPYEVYYLRCGVCQDFANLFICLARLLNIPARYRVGYIYTGSEYENKQQGDATHAWVELYLPNIGWMGFDPTNCCLQSQNHIRIACGRNYRDATPTSGTIFRGGGHETLHTVVQVVRLSKEELYEQINATVPRS